MMLILAKASESLRNPKFPGVSQVISLRNPSKKVDGFKPLPPPWHLSLAAMLPWLPFLSLAALVQGQGGSGIAPGAAGQGHDEYVSQRLHARYIFLDHLAVGWEARARGTQG